MKPIEFLADSLDALRAVASLPEAVVVLHCFQKKTQRTAKVDLDLAAARFKQLARRS